MSKNELNLLELVGNSDVRLDLVQSDVYRFTRSIFPGLSR